ncbi:leukocyte elastase inhibitor-like [Biomphalaria glabrata]|uniref:Leukocyte elastase inhibitor-like n=1 Tax=Biomphalaria glabrata TaxID=6526 RepID=A0A9W2YK66_BIOGL|nr:leukocyte elastase inhibitor-like [Biomphalaria glabrata]
MKLIYAVIVALIGQLVSADQQQQLALSSASSDFSQRLYQNVALNEHSIVYSPYSIHSALTMTSLGARGDTETEMKNTLGITSLGNSVHTIYKELIEQINSVTDVELNTANAIFVKPNFQIVPKFTQDTTDYYSAQTANIDLSANGGPEKPINDYIANKTENIIQNVLQPGTIDDDTVMLLINTIFFNGTWEATFDKHQTRNQDFNQLPYVVKQVEMMTDDRNVNIKRDDVNKVDIAELPFKGGRFSFYIALPQAIDGITDLEQLLARPERVKQLFTGLSSVRVQLSIPKFKTETTLSLNTPLKDMGIRKAFISKVADFSGITSAKIFISQVLHKAVIEVMETGTVAAAATVVVLVTESAQLPPTESFIADHPFVYFLRDNQTGQILFQGKFSG